MRWMYFLTSVERLWAEVPPCCAGCSPCCRGWDLHQTEPEDRWVHPAGRLWVEHVWVWRPSLWVPHGPHQLPALHLPGLHSPPSESISRLHCSRGSFILDSVTVCCFSPLTFTLSCFILPQSCLYSVIYLCCMLLCSPDTLCWRTLSTCLWLWTSCCNVTVLGPGLFEAVVHCCSAALPLCSVTDLHELQLYFPFCSSLRLPTWSPVSQWAAVTSPPCLCGTFNF